MRTVYWLFVISVALFLSGIGFVIVGARPAQGSAPVEPPPTKPVASVRQIMNGVVAPAAAVVFGSVGTIVTVDRVDEKFPKNDAEWEAVADSAAALAEAANLLMMDNRAIDNDTWIKMSRAMSDAAVVALKAIEAKDADQLLASGEGLYLSCDNCHQRYQRGS